MRIKLLFIYVFSMGINAREIVLSSSEETIIAYDDQIIATNCSPGEFGHLSTIPNLKRSKNSHLLKFTPTKGPGEIVCSAKARIKGVISVKFILKRNIKNPIVEVFSLKNYSKSQLLTDFSLFIKGETTGFTNIKINSAILTSQFKYKFIEKYQTSQSAYLYKVKVIPRKRNKKGHIRIRSKELSPIVYSHYKGENGQESAGLSREKTSYMYLLSRETLTSKTLRKYLR